jgi:hypothetical protein
MFDLKLTQLLRQLLLLTGVAQAAGIAIPSQVADAIAKVSSILGSVSFDFKNPNSVAAAIADVELLLKDALAVSKETPLGPKIDSVLADLVKFPALVHDLVTGQVITVASVPMSIDGEEFTVKVFATRADSEEARHLGE